MTKPLHPPNSGGDNGLAGKGPNANQKPRIPLWQAFLLPVAATLIFFLLLEGGLALVGVTPALETEDPFVGYASYVPLFVPASGPTGTQMMTTASNKRLFFNQQTFARQKAPGSYRIFTLGGSTTYGRPYDDLTSFSGWLREFLPVADTGKKWEVINAGGISYASYRVAHLMEELIKYQPDLFIVYTGHNEFLEERTYGQIKNIPGVVRSTVSLLAKTRSWTAMKETLQTIGLHPSISKQGQHKMSGEVDAILDNAAGLERYSRDDPLQQNILRHFRLSLERMIALARSVGAEIMFISPASSLKDCSPFKSEHTPGLTPEERQRSEGLLLQAREAMQQNGWQRALDFLAPAVALDPRHAELQYRKGLALLALGRIGEAEAALRLARDEDVCPLRALTPIVRIVADTAIDQGVDFVDFSRLLEQRMQAEHGYPIPGEEYFLDHVHPTINGHKILALAIIEAMSTQNLVRTEPDWDQAEIARVAEIVERRIDQDAHGRALANLARVLLWANKREDAARAARKALETAGEVPQVAADSASILVSVYLSQGQTGLALETIRKALETVPGAIELHLKLGINLLDRTAEYLEEAAGHLLLVCQQMPLSDKAHAFYGLAMARRGRALVAYESLKEALRLNPNNELAQKTLAWIRPKLGSQLPDAKRPMVMLESYPSEAPRRVVQLHRNSKGRHIAHGLDVEFYENGQIKHVLDVRQGQLDGVAKLWDAEGRLLSQRTFRQGESDGS